MAPPTPPTTFSGPGLSLQACMMCFATVRGVLAHAKSEGKRGAKSSKNDAPEGRKWSQNGSKMAPWRPLGAYLAPAGSPEAFGEALGRLLGPSWRLWGSSWGLLGRSWGSFWLPRSCFLELFGCPGGHFRGHFCNRGWQRENINKKQRFSPFL